MRIFEYQSYKEFLIDWIKKVGERGSLSRMAEAAGCHRSYLSQVLSTKVDLTLDHAVNLISFLGLSGVEEEYFLTCVMHDRSTTASAKKFFLTKLKKLAKEQETLSGRLTDAERPSSETEGAGVYYGESEFAELHLWTSVKGTQNPRALAEKCGISLEKAKVILAYLVKTGLIEQQGENYTHTGKSIFLDRKSPFTRMNHLNWRLRAVEDSYSEESVHFTNVFSISKKDWPSLRTNLLGYIEEQRGKIHRSGAEEVGVFCCDLFLPVSS